MGQDTEEWAHLQYFVNVDPTTPSFIISPAGRGHGRAAELVEVMRRIGRTVIAVVPEGDEQIATRADWVLPVVGEVPEVFSPMVYAVAGELFSAYLSQAVDEPPFRGFADVYEPGGITIRNSAVIDRVPV
jgi:glucosamine--fructose-6-phosphate aminotransferase (isomerizing)